MTDNEISNALEWCEQFENNIVFNGSGDEKCVQALQMMVVIKHALRNYNRQKAKIERLKIENAKLKGYKTTDWLTRGISPEQLEREKIQAWKSEAIKEFAEMLKWKATAIHKSIDRHRRYEIDNDFIDNLVKEMVGDAE